MAIEAFKVGDEDGTSVIVSGNATDLRTLSNAIRSLGSPESHRLQAPIKLSKIATTSFEGLTDVVFVPSCTSRLSLQASRVDLYINPTYASKYLALLDALMTKGAGHQYFDAEQHEPAGFQLVVSLGEYER